MKLKYLIAAFLTLSVVACKKDKDPDPVYMNTAAGSTWNYKVTENSGTGNVSSTYVLTSTNRDTTINTRSYHVYTRSNGGNQYMAKSGTDYYSFEKLPAAVGAQNFENLYLKSGANVGETWVQTITVNVPNVPLPVTITQTNKLEEKGLTKIVNGFTYNKVFHVSTTLTLPAFPGVTLTTNIHSYYADKYGLIQNNSQINFTFGTTSSNTTSETILESASLK